MFNHISKKTMVLILSVLVILTACILSISNAEKPAAKEISVPQDTYSVSTEIKSFDLNVSGSEDLSYSSSDDSVASVSSAGVVNVNSNGTSYITISDGVSSKKVKVKVSEYEPADGEFIEGKGNVDKQSGDSTGKEICLKAYPGYEEDNHSRSWGFIVRCNDPEIADKAALAVSYIADNDHFGFESRKPDDQQSVDNRASIYNTVVEVTGKNPSVSDLKKIASISSNADTSCTPTCLSGYWLYYDMSDQLALKWIDPYNETAYNYYCGAVNVEYHQLEEAIDHINNEYKKKGMLEPFTIIYISAGERENFFKESNISKNLKRGDIICSCPSYKESGHTGMMM